MKHAWFCLDPGVTTGWALLDDAGKILGTSVWGTEELRATLDLLIRKCYTNGIALTAVVERMPQVGGLGALAQKLERVRRDIELVVRETYEIPTTYITPGTWKTSRVAQVTRLPREWRGEAMMSHQKDAIRMGRYAQEVRKEKDQ